MLFKNSHKIYHSPHDQDPWPWNIAIGKIKNGRVNHNIRTQLAYTETDEFSLYLKAFNNILQAGEPKQLDKLML